MIARVCIFLPYAFIIPESEKFDIYETKADGYSIRFFQPLQSEQAKTYTGADSITINDVNAYNADVLCLDFQKEEYDRGESGNDPPGELIEETVNYFLFRLKYITGSHHIKPFNFKSSSWDMRYLNDDGTELPKAKEFVEGRKARKYIFSYTTLNKQIWDDLFSLDPNHDVPAWRILIIDARGLLPQVGPAIVLIYTALEVFMSKTLDKIVATGKVNHELWEWINNRGAFYKEPSVVEQFDTLSRVIIGKSIKEDQKLWKAFNDLKDARNSFVHEGVAKIGKKVKKAVTEHETIYLMEQTNKIIDFITQVIPEELRWPEFKYKMRVEVSKEITTGKDKKSSDMS